MPTPTHEVYRVLLKIRGVDSLWTFRIHDDDSLQIDIEYTGDTPMLQTMTTDSVIRDFDQHVDFTYVTTEHVLKKHTPSPGMHTCSFFLAQREEGCQYAAYSKVEKVTCVLSREFGFQCELDYSEIYKHTIARDVFADLEKALCNPVACSVAVEPVRATLYPLTCGYYTLKGGLMDDFDGFSSPIILHVELLPGGRVAGTGFESGFHRDPRTVPLTGTWSRDSLEISQNFVVFPPHQHLDLLQLRGRVTQYAFIGQWIFDGMSFDSDEAETSAANLRVTAMRRYWNPEVHALFPEAFKQAVRWCLVSSLRRSNLAGPWLPSALWPHVLAFCDSSWFVGGNSDHSLSARGETS